MVYMVDTTRSQQPDHNHHHHPRPGPTSGPRPGPTSGPLNQSTRPAHQVGPSIGGPENQSRWAGAPALAMALELVTWAEDLGRGPGLGPRAGAEGWDRLD